MKLTKTLLLFPTVCLLASCAQTEMSVPEKDKQLVSFKQTEAPTDFVVYPDDRPSIPDGKIVFEKHMCASCHGMDGSGGTGPAIKDPMKIAQSKPVELYKSLTYGKDPQHHLLGTMSNRDVWNLVFYCRSLGATPLTQAEIDEINPVFGSNCAVCHGTKGDGDGPLARNLEPMPANFQTFKRFYDRTDDVLFDHIANGIAFEGMPNFLGKEDKKKNVKFNHAYIKKLVQYVRTFHVSNDPTNPELAKAGAATATATGASAGAPSAEDKASAETAGTGTGESKTEAESPTTTKEAAQADTTTSTSATEAGAQSSIEKNGKSNEKSP